VPKWTAADIARAVRHLHAADAALKDTKVSSEEQIITSLLASRATQAARIAELEAQLAALRLEIGDWQITADQRGSLIDGMEEAVQEMAGEINELRAQLAEAQAKVLETITLEEQLECESELRAALQQAQADVPDDVAATIREALEEKALEQKRKIELYADLHETGQITQSEIPIWEKAQARLVRLDAALEWLATQRPTAPDVRDLAAQWPALPDLPGGVDRFGHLPVAGVEE
jgi:chromosome segregation ATPase